MSTSLISLLFKKFRNNLKTNFRRNCMKKFPFLPLIGPYHISSGNDLSGSKVQACLREMHWQYSWIFLPLKLFWAPTHWRAKKREFENNIHKHTAEGYWTGERNTIPSIDTVAMFTVPDPDLGIRGEEGGGGGRGDGLPKNFSSLVQK